MTLGAVGHGMVAGDLVNTAARLQGAAPAGAVLVGEATRDGARRAIVFEAAGEDAAVEDAVAAARPGGRVVLVGIPSSDSTTFRASTARHKGLTLLLSRRMRASDLPRAIELTVRGDIDPRPLVSARVPLERAAEAFDRLVRREGFKTIVRPS